MAGPILRGARAVAFRTLQELERRDALADELLHRAFAAASPPLAPRDRALAVELVYGVLRHRLTLDWRLEQVSTRPMAGLPLAVLTALRLGAYQILHLSRVPDSAAVNESVELVKSLPGRDWSGFVNAVLRALLRTPAPPWPDPAVDPAHALSVRYACPPWLVQRWVERYGAERAAHLCRRTLETPPLTVRTNTLHITRPALLERFESLGLRARPTEVSRDGIVLDKHGVVTELPLFPEGAYYIEDEAAQLVPPLLDPRPGERILDACAAPGGKATHLAALMENRGTLVALDASRRRLHLLDENCRRLGISIITPILVDAARLRDAVAESRLPPDQVAELARPFDRALVDAPCSGLGVLRRHPEAKWRRSASELAEHAVRQAAILAEAAHLLRPGGVIVYSTCSTEPEENERVIETFCAAHPEFSRQSVAPFVPPAGRMLVTPAGELSTMFAPQSMDGFFAARLTKAL